MGSPWWVLLTMGGGMVKMTIKPVDYCTCSEKVQENRSARDKKGQWKCNACGLPLDSEDAAKAGERFWRRYGRFE